MQQVDSRPLYVELAGLPGAGKSAVREELIRALTARGYRCGVQSSMGGRVHGPAGPVNLSGRSWKRRGPVEKATGYVGLLFRMRGIAGPALRLAISRPAGFGEGFRAARSLLLHVRKVWNAAEIAASGQSDLIIFDQGVIPYVRELLAAAGQSGRDRIASLLDPTLEALSNVRVVVITLEADVDTLAQRLATRPRQLGAYDVLTGAEATEVLRTHAAWFDQIVDYLRTRAGDDVIELDATAPVSASVERSIEVITALLTGGSVRATPG